MATSLHDLFDAITDHLNATDPSPEHRADAVQALATIGRTLHRLTDDGLSPDVGGYRERFVRELAAACPADTPLTDDPGQRLSMLTGAIGDTVQILRPELRMASRWATALELATAARRLADAATEDGEDDLLSPYGRLRRACVLVERTGAVEPPSAEQAQLLDRGIPTPHHQLLGAAAEQITGAMAGLIHHTRPGTDLSIAEVLAVCIAAETLCAHAATRPPNKYGSESLTSAAHAWGEIGAELRPFNDGSRRRHDDQPTVVAFAIRLHDTLNQAPTPRVSASSTDRERTSGREVDDAVAACIPQLTTLGQHLSETTRHWATKGQVLAHAHQLPRRERHIQQRLAGHRTAGLIHADAIDLAPVTQAIRTAMEAVPTPGAGRATKTDGRAATPGTGHRHAVNRRRISDWGSTDNEDSRQPAPAQYRAVESRHAHQGLSR